MQVINYNYSNYNGDYHVVITMQQGNIILAVEKDRIIKQTIIDLDEDIAMLIEQIEERKWTS